MDSVTDAQLEGWLYWVVPAIALPAFLFFHLSKNAALKWQFWPPFMIAFGLLYRGSRLVRGRRQRPRVRADLGGDGGPHRRAQHPLHADSATGGATQMNQNFLSPPKFSKCGGELK